jgi:hypothetical protein
MKCPWTKPMEGKGPSVSLSDPHAEASGKPQTYNAGEQARMGARKENKPH